MLRHARLLLLLLARNVLSDANLDAAESQAEAQAAQAAPASAADATHPGPEAQPAAPSG